MDITDSILSAYQEGVSTLEEDRAIIDAITTNPEFSDMMDIMSEIDSLDEIEEIRNEFNEKVDTSFNFNDYKIDIK